MRALFISVALISLLAACDTAPDYRYKMTAEVETSAGVQRFSTVREVVQTNALMIESTEARALSRTLKGEALIIRLTGGETVFGIMDNTQLDPEDQALPWDNTKDGMDRMRAHVEQGGAHALARELPMGDGSSHQLWPRLVRFERLNDPKSIKDVDPDAMPGGARLRRITIEITDEPATEEISSLLPWLPDYCGQSFSGDRYSVSSSLLQKSTGSFKQPCERTRPGESGR